MGLVTCLEVQCQGSAAAVGPHHQLSERVAFTTQSAASAGLSASEWRSGRREAARRSARMPRVLRRSWALPSLRTLLLHRHLATIDKQAIAFSLALAAYSAVSQPRTTARLARRRQFFIHWGWSYLGRSQNKSPWRWSVHRGPQRTLPTANVRARNKLPKGLSRRAAEGIVVLDMGFADRNICRDSALRIFIAFLSKPSDMGLSRDVPAAECPNNLGTCLHAIAGKMSVCTKSAPLNSSGSPVTFASA
jgi:hypothetical protein